MPNAHCIIGSGSDIAQALANSLLNNGEFVHLITRTPEKLTQASQHDSCVIAGADVTDTASLKEAMINFNGNYQSLTYFPGSICLKSLASVNDEEVLENFKINALGALNAVKFAAPKFIRSGGSIVFISTVAVQRGFTNHSIISMCKGALEGLTKSLAKELSPNIRVNCIAPSLVRTKLSDKLLENPAVVDALAKAHPLKRLGEAKDISNAIEFLISPESNWVTGQIIHVDGGRSTLD